MSENKSYMGDGLYVAISNWEGQLIVTAEDGISAQETVYMEAEQIQALIRFAVEHNIIGAMTPIAREVLPPAKPPTHPSLAGTMSGRFSSDKPNVSAVPKVEKEQIQFFKRKSYSLEERAQAEARCNRTSDKENKPKLENPLENMTPEEIQGQRVVALPKAFSERGVGVVTGYMESNTKEPDVYHVMWDDGRGIWLGLHDFRLAENQLVYMTPQEIQGQRVVGLASELEAKGVGVVTGYASGEENTYRVIWPDKSSLWLSVCEMRLANIT